MGDPMMIVAVLGSLLVPWGFCAVHGTPLRVNVALGICAIVGAGVLTPFAYALGHDAPLALAWFLFAGLWIVLVLALVPGVGWAKPRPKTVADQEDSL